MTATTDAEAPTAVAKLIRFLETGVAPNGLFAPDMFADVTFPHWRVQATSADEMIDVRLRNHPQKGTVRVERLDLTERGFVLQLEERWDDGGESWYAREIFRADVVDDLIAEMAAYCTGDWDEAKQREHAAAVTLVRP
jgi:hypothetical protein